MTRPLRRMFVLCEAGGGVPEADLDVGDTQPNQSAAPTRPKEASSGLRITGDKQTMQVLFDVLDMASHAHSDEDVVEWAEQASEAIAQGMRRGMGEITVTLPSYSSTPSLDSFNDDAGPGPDDEEI